MFSVFIFPAKLRRLLDRRTVGYTEAVVVAIIEVSPKFSICDSLTL